MKTTKTIAALALTAIAGASLVGCSMLETEKSPSTLSADGTYVMAPADGGLFTMKVAGQKVEITREDCSPDGGPVLDPRQTAFGELAPLAEDAEDASATSLSWLERGLFASVNEEDSAQVELLSDGQILRVGEFNFFTADDAQGKALKDQFISSCATAPEAKPSESAQPSESAAPTASTDADDAESSAAPSPEATESPSAPNADNTGELD